MEKSKEKLENLVKQYGAIEVNISSGSLDWSDIKADFELIDITVIGLFFTLEQKPLDQHTMNQKINRNC